LATCYKYIIKVGDKEIEIDEKVVKILNIYAKTEMDLEKLAEELKLDDWMEAYEFIKKVPAWIMWTPSLIWKKELERCNTTKETKVIKI
jgi:hypothetical protein